MTTNANTTDSIVTFRDDTIPSDLKALPHWVCWRAVPNGERIEKIPVCASTGNNASSTEPRTWTTYARNNDRQSNTFCLR